MDVSDAVGDTLGDIDDEGDCVMLMDCVWLRDAEGVLEGDGVCVVDVVCVGEYDGVDDSDCVKVPVSLEVALVDAVCDCEGVGLQAVFAARIRTAPYDASVPHEIPESELTREPVGIAYPAEGKCPPIPSSGANILTASFVDTTSAKLRCSVVSSIHCAGSATLAYAGEGWTEGCAGADFKRVTGSPVALSAR